MPLGTAVPSAPETHAILRESPDNPSTAEIIKTEFRDAKELRVEYDSLHNNLEIKTLSAVQLIDEEVIPTLVRLQALLSQRGARHQELCREAHLPTWTEEYESFRQKFNLKSFRTFQHQQRQLALAGNSGQGGGSTPTKSSRFRTGLDRVALYDMLTGILTQLEKMGVGAPITPKFMEMVAEYRDILSVEPFQAAPPVRSDRFNLTVAQVRKIGGMPRRRKPRTGFVWPKPQ